MAAGRLVIPATQGSGQGMEAGLGLRRKAWLGLLEKQIPMPNQIPLGEYHLGQVHGVHENMVGRQLLELGGLQNHRNRLGRLLLELSGLQDHRNRLGRLLLELSGVDSGPRQQDRRQNLLHQVGWFEAFRPGGSPKW